MPVISWSGQATPAAGVVQRRRYRGEPISWPMPIEPAIKRLGVIASIGASGLSRHVTGRGPRGRRPTARFGGGGVEGEYAVQQAEAELLLPEREDPVTTKSTTADADARIGSAFEQPAWRWPQPNATRCSRRMSFQQIQKYEKGRDRISVACLQVLAKALGVSGSLIARSGRWKRTKTKRGSPCRGARPRCCARSRRSRMRPSGGRSLSLSRRWP